MILNVEPSLSFYDVNYLKWNYQVSKFQWINYKCDELMFYSTFYSVNQIANKTLNNWTELINKNWILFSLFRQIDTHTWLERNKKTLIRKPPSFFLDTQKYIWYKSQITTRNYFKFTIYSFEVSCTRKYNHFPILQIESFNYTHTYYMCTYITL